MQAVGDFVYRARYHGRSFSQRCRDLKLERDSPLGYRLDQRPPPPPPPIRSFLSQNIQAASRRFLTNLPLEIRRIIYGHVYGGNLIVLLHGTNRLYHRRFRLECNPATASLSHIFKCDRPLQEWIAAIYTQTGTPKSRTHSRISLSLLQTCHAIYAEAIPILYSSNCFVILSPMVLLDFRDRGIRAQHLALIRHLHLYYVNLCSARKFPLGIQDPYPGWDDWASFWEIMRTMQLESLRMWMDEDTSYGDRIYVDPMLAVHGLKHAEVKYERGQRKAEIYLRRQPHWEEEIVAEWTRKKDDF